MVSLIRLNIKGLNEIYFLGYHGLVAAEYTQAVFINSGGSPRWLLRHIQIIAFILSGQQRERTRAGGWCEVAASQLLSQFRRLMFHFFGRPP